MNTRSYRKIYRYVGAEFLFSSFTAFLFFFGVFFINQLLLLAEEILSKKVPIIDVARLILYSLPSIVAFSAPFSSLVGCLMSVGKFASSNEIIAFKASGIPLSRLFFPILLLGGVLSAASFITNDFFLPWGTMNFTRLYKKLLYTHPELEMESYSIKNYQNSILTNGLVEGEKIHQILILDKDPEGAKRVITAQVGTLDKSVEGVVSLTLEDVDLHTLGGKEKERYSYSSIERMSYNILLKNISISFRGLGPREMSSLDVYKEIQKKQKDLQERIQAKNIRVESLLYRYQREYEEGIQKVYKNPALFVSIKEWLERFQHQIEDESNRKIQDRSLQLYLIEFYKKFSLPMGCIFFILFAFPTALFTRRSGKVVGFGLGLLVSIFYWGLLVAGQTLGVRASFPPFLSMWIPNLIILFLGAISYGIGKAR